MGEGRTPSRQKRCYLAAAVCHLIAGIVGGGEGPHQLCTAVPVAAQCFPSCSCPAAGLLNWRFVSAQGNNTGRGVRRKRGESKEAGVLQEDAGRCAWQDCQGSRNGGFYNRQPREEKAEAWKGGLPGNQVWVDGPGGRQLWWIHFGGL